MWSQVWTDILVSWAFTMVWIPSVSKLWNVTPALIFSKAAWTTWSWLADKWFIAWEVAFTWMYASVVISQVVSNYYKENHFDTDKYYYKNWKRVERKK